MGFLSESDSSRKVTLKSVLAVAVLGPDGYQECVGIWHLAGSEMPTSDRRKLPVQECIHIWLLAGSEMPMSDRRKLPVRRPHSPHYLRDTFSNTGGCSFYSLGFGSPVSRDEWLGRWQCSSEHWHSHRSRSTVSPISKRGLRRVCLARFAIPCLLRLRSFSNIPPESHKNWRFLNRFCFFMSCTHKKIQITVGRDCFSMGLEMNSRNDS